MIKLSEIKARCEAATPGPWTVDIETEADGIVAEQPIQCTVHGLNRSFWSEEWADEAEWKQSCANAEFVADARTDLPALVDWAERVKLFLENYFKGSVRVEPLSEEEIRANIQMATNEGLELLREIGGND